MLRLSTQRSDTVGYTEFRLFSNIQLLHGAVTLQPKEFNLHVSSKVHLEIIMNERQPVGMVWFIEVVGAKAERFPLRISPMRGLL